MFHAPRQCYFRSKDKIVCHEWQGVFCWVSFESDVRTGVLGKNKKINLLQCTKVISPHSLIAALLILVLHKGIYYTYTRPELIPAGELKLVSSPPPPPPWFSLQVLVQIKLLCFWSTAGSTGVLIAVLRLLGVFYDVPFEDLRVRLLTWAVPSSSLV